MTPQDHLTNQHAGALEDLKTFLNIPSVSTQPERRQDVQRCADWLKTRFENAGLEHAEVIQTAMHPIVYADWLHAPGAPTVLLYGHYDVQPAADTEHWVSPPFEATVREQRIYARGASDMKGNVHAMIRAIEALLETTRSLPVNVKFLIEGEEEIASPSFPAIAKQERERFKADYCICADSLQLSEHEPMLVLSTRGVVGFELTVTGARIDLHSGLQGGVVMNPLVALARVVASFHHDDGRIAVDGFYDQVIDIPAQTRALLARTAPSEASRLEALGVPALWGEAGFSAAERSTLRPTLEPNGLWGGYQGAGNMTVIPSQAHLKVTCRIVPNQDPAHILECLRRHIEQHTPPGVTIHATYGGDTPAYHVPLEHPAHRVIAAVLRELYGRDPVPSHQGGTVPILPMLQRHLGVTSLAFGFSLPDDQYHAPNEFWRLSSFHRAPLAFVRLLEELGRLEPTNQNG
jgi:acetylornithine deacetylase/succinyl-diaminopimelate desuccinylase-like protein